MSFFRRNPWRLAAATALSLLWVCTANAAEGKRTVRVHFPGGESILAELALSVEQRTRGLMFRDRLDSREGMLFVFEEETVHSFWMKNVKFPIDILWLDRGKKLVHIAKRVPPCAKEPCPLYSPVLPALYVLELTAGRSDELGLKPGVRLDFSLPKGP
jgi:uncharacterized protein